MKALQLYVSRNSFFFASYRKRKENPENHYIEIKNYSQSFVLVLLTIIAVSTTIAVDYCDRCNGDHIACNNTGEFGPDCPAGVTVVPMTADIIASILNRHNTARMNIANGQVSGYETADRMIQMSWDAELASFAEMAAKTCIFDHIKCWTTAVYQYAGQNIAMDVATEKPTDAINAMIDSWYNEYANCNMDQIKEISSMTGSNGKTFGHFTQVVMANSMKIGCGMVNYLQSSWLYSHLVCNYAQTNVWGWPVYTLGTPCSGCTSGCSVTYPGLCNPGEVITW